MAARIDSGIDPKFFEEFKQAIATVYELREAMIMTSKQQVNIEVNGAASKTLVDLAGNEMKLAAAVKETTAAFDSYAVSLTREQALKAQWNGSTETLVGLKKKLTTIEKELEQATLTRAKTDTEASKQFLLNKQAEKVAAETLLIQTKKNIAEEIELDRLIQKEEKEKQIAYAKTAQIKKEAEASALINAPLLITNEHQTGANAANADGTVVNAEQTAELQAQTKATQELGAATTQTNEAKAGFVAMTEAEIVAEKEAETTMVAMAAQLKLLQNEYKALTATQRASAEGTALNTQIQELDKEIKTLDASLGNSQRNVGNYGSAFERAAERGLTLDNVAAKLVTSFIRMGVHFLAFTVIIKGIEWIIDKFTGLGKEADNAEKALKKYDDTLKSIESSQIGSAQQEIAHANVLTSIASNVTESMKNRVRAVEELQKTYPDYFGNLSKEAILQGDVTKAINATTDALINRAYAQAAEKKIAAAAEKEYNLTLQLRKNSTDQDKAQDIIDRYEHPDYKKGIPVQFDYDQARLQLHNLQGDYKNLTDEIYKSRAEQEGFAKDAADSATKAGQTIFGKDTKTHAPGNHASAEYQGAKELNDALADLKKQQIEQDVAANEEIFKNDKASLEDRLLAYQNYESDLIYIAEAEKNKKIANANAELKDIEKLQNDGKKKDAEQDKDLTDRHAAALVKKQAAEEEYQAKVASITSKGAAVIRGIEDDAEKDKYNSVVDGLKKIDASYQEAYNSEKKAIDDKHTAGTISEKKYQEGLVDLNRKYAKEILQAQIDNLKDLVVLFPAGSEQAQKLIDKIAELQKKLNETKSTKPKVGVLGFSDEELKLLGEVTTEVELYTQATNKLNDALDAQSKARIDAIQKEIDAIEKRKQTDIDAVTAAAETGVITADEKQRRIAAINAKAQQEEDNRNQKIASEKRQAAERDKALAIAEIVIKTALAVVNQLAGGDPYSAVPRAIAIGVLGAAELAAAIATPIPEFWKGTENAPKGLARLGEKGTELVIPKTGAPWLADKDMIANLQGGEVIKTHTETMEIMKMFGLGMPTARPGQKNQNEELLDELKESREVLKAIRDKRFPAIPAKQSWWDHYYYMHTK